MDNKFKIIKTKCSVCNRTHKRIVNVESQNTDSNFYYNEKNEPVCKDCERKYRICGAYSARGYGYKYSTDPFFTIMDKSSTPTFGLELEVAGNIKNIEKIDKITSGTRQECSIGYDTSVEGAQFELSFAPGTYYWYYYESNLRAVCKMLQKDKWTIESPTIGMHLHIGNIPLSDTYCKIMSAVHEDNIFWEILKIVAERDYNKYCAPVFRHNHHDAISRSDKWRTIEFRIFSGTYDFNKIIMRMKFIRQLLNNLTTTGVNWYKFSDKTKIWFLDLLEKSNCPEEIKEKIKLLFKEDGHRESSPESEISIFWKRKIEEEEYEESRDYRDDYEEEDDEYYENQ